MSDYLLSIFLNFFFFILLGISYHIISVDGAIDGHLWMLLLTGWFIYSPALLISNISLFLKKKIKNSCLRIVVIPVSLNLIILSVLLPSSQKETVLLFFFIGQLLSSSIIFRISRHRT